MPQIPAGWKETTLGNLIYSGEIQIKNFLRKPISSNERSKIQWEYPYYWAASAIDSLNSFSLEGLHLLIAEDWTVVTNKNSPMLQLVDGKFNVSNHAHILQGNDNQETRFLYYLLSNVNVLPYITWAVQPKLSKENLLKICFLIPESLPEQQAIAAILSSFDDKIELLRAENQTLEQMGQELFKERFGKSPNIKVWMLGDWVDVKRGSSPRPIQDYISEKGYKWLKISDASAVDSPFIFDIKECIREEGLNKTILLKSGTLVLSNSATPGIPKILAVDSCIHDGWLHFPKSRFSNEFLYLLFKEIRPKLIQQGSGSVFTNLKTDILKKYEIPIPDQETLSKFDLVIKPLFNKIRANSEQIQTLSATRDQLLPKLMSGEVRVEF